MLKQAEILGMVQNLDPSLKVLMERVLTPQGTSQVASSPHFMFIVCSLVNGYSPIEVSRTLLKEKGQHIPAFEIRDYLVSYIPADLTRPALQLKWMQQTGRVDEVSVLENVVRIQTQKVVEQMDRPGRSVDDREGYRRDVDLLMKAATHSLDAKIKTGRVPRLAGTSTTTTDPLQVTHTHKHEHVHKLPEGVDAYRAKKVLSALEEIKKVTDGGPATEPESN